MLGMVLGSKHLSIFPFAFRFREIKDVKSEKLGDYRKFKNSGLCPLPGSDGIWRSEKTRILNLIVSQIAASDSRLQNVHSAVKKIHMVRSYWMFKGTNFRSFLFFFLLPAPGVTEDQNFCNAFITRGWWQLGWSCYHTLTLEKQLELYNWTGKTCGERER